MNVICGDLLKVKAKTDTIDDMIVQYGDAKLNPLVDKFLNQ